MSSAPYPRDPATASVGLRILLADDHEMVRLAMRHALAPLAANIDWLEASSAEEAELRLAEDPDLALLDLNMPGSDGAGWIGRLRAQHPTLPVIVVSAEESAPMVRSLIASGVAGFIPKSDSAAVILQAVRLVLAGGTYAPLRLLGGDGWAQSDARQPQTTCSSQHHGLTQRQKDVLELLARGMPNKLIARELGLSEGTVKVHLLTIFRVLGVRNRTEAVVEAQKRLQATGA